MQSLRRETASTFAAAALMLAGCALTPPEAPVELPAPPPPPVAKVAEPLPQTDPAPPPQTNRAPLPQTDPAPPPEALEPVAQKPPAVRLLDTTVLPPFEGERHELPPPPPVAKLDRTAPTDDLWLRLRRGFAMTDIQSRLVDERMRWYVANQDYLQRMFERTRRYLFYIVEELEKRHLPTELALLPMVESAFNPMAYSRSHASGLWQFIPGTGRRYELTQNWWYDGRRDVVASTGAALDYLEDLYEMHGDWHLALASYNWGENNVARAIQKNRRTGKPTDYLSLRMPRETRGYIPKLQALKNLIANPAAHGIVLRPIPNEPYFVTVEKNRDIDVLLAAKLAEMPVEEFVALNPGFSRPIIRSDLVPRIVLPADKAEVFRANLEQLDSDELVSWKSYTPRRGEDLASIAKKHGLTLAQLKEVNGIHPRSRRMPKQLVVPIERDAAAFEPMPIMYGPPIPAGGRTHIVRRGETPWSIARRYGVPLKDLQRWNRIRTHIRAGQRLVIF